MPTMDLVRWNERLTRHFAELRQVRRRREDLPLFALEHGLNQEEIRELSAAIRAHIRTARPDRVHALAWIVYAAEIGYRFSGDEYWQTFEGDTPGWLVNGERSWIRSRFRKFHDDYGGAKPRGAWADHFSIICWPITHAVLPKDLQQQLARILYELRYSFSQEILESPIQLGEAIASRSWNATARFQNFAQETALVGQIATALLQGNVGADTLIHRSTLQRITDDLEHERAGRQWLKDARRFAQERARVRGLAFGRPRASVPQKPEEARAEISSLGIEPRVVLQPTSSDSWQVSLEIPDLSHLLQKFPATQTVLAGSRCTVAGAAGRPLARGRCLHGSQRIVLSRWPRSDEVLLQFEERHPQLEFLLRTDCLLRPGPVRLLRIAADGNAYEMRGHRVRAGGRYVLLNETKTPIASPHIRPATLDCAGISGALLQLPDALTPEWEAELQKLGLVPAKSIEVWPAGLAAVVWDGEGYGEWPASEQPCLAVRCDHAVGTLQVSLDRDSTLQVSDIPLGEPIFLELPALALGLHKVTFATAGDHHSSAESIGDLDIVMRIREARPLAPAISRHGPVSVDMDPPNPTLEELWEGRFEITIRGPKGRPVKCQVALFNALSETASLTRQLPPLSLPVSSDQWKRHFYRHFQRSKDCQRAYDDARSVELTFSVDEFGEFTLRCERAFTPLRWAIRRKGDVQIAKLYEDVGTDQPLSVARIAFERPAEMESLEPVEPVREYTAPSSGGLYLAKIGDYSAAIILGPVVRTFGDLGFTPVIGGTDRATHTLLQLIDCCSVWGAARLPGDIFSEQRRRKVLQALTSHLACLMSAGNWAEAEAEASNGSSDGILALRRAISKNREAAEIGSALSLETPSLSRVDTDARIERFAALARLFLQPPPGDLRWISELALRLASYPMNIRAWAGDSLQEGLEKLLDRPTLMRAARFLVISIERQLNSSASGDALYAGWSWR